MNSYFSWPSVFGGTAIAVAISLILQNFGAGIGLAYDPVWVEEPNAMFQIWLGGLWLLLMALASSTAGGYVAGRMRPRWTDVPTEEVEFRDGCNGLAVWATSTLVVAGTAAFGVALAAIGAAGAASDAEQASTAINPLLQNGSTIVAFATAAGSALGAGAAWFAAKQGGEHRDENVSIAMLTPRFLRR